MTRRKQHFPLALLAVAFLIIAPFSQLSVMGQDSSPKPAPELQALINKAYQANSDGKFDDGLRLFSDVLRKARDLKDEVGEAWGWAGVGFACAGLERTREALDCYEKSRLLYRKTGNKIGEAFTVNEMGAIFLKASEPRQAMKLYEEALKLAKEAKNGFSVGVTLRNIGMAFHMMDQKQKALERFEQALDLLEKAGDKPNQASVLTDIGNVYYDLGQPPRALEFYERALKKSKESGNKPEEAYALGNIGFFYRAIGQYDKALVQHKLALQMWEEMKNRRMQALLLTDVGEEYSNLNQSKEALNVLEKALILHRAIPNVRGEADTLTDMGIVYAMKLGQRQKGLEMYRQALPLHRAVGNRGSEAQTLSRIGMLDGLEGHPQQALGRYKQALAIQKEIGDKRGAASTLHQVALAESRQGRIADAEGHAAEAVACLETLRVKLAGYNEAKSSFLAAHLSSYYLHIRLLIRIGKPAEAFAAVQKTKGRSLLDLMAYGRVDLSAALTPEERQQEQDLLDQANVLNAQMVKEGVENEVGAKKRFTALQQTLRETERQLQTLTDTLYARHPGLAQKRAARTTTIADVAKFLPADTALLEYVFVSKDEVRVFVVTIANGKSVLRSYPIKVTAAMLTKRSAEFRAVCADPRKEYRRQASTLYKLLIRPAERALNGKKRLVICPDGPLWDVPFQALVARQKSLSEHYEIAYAYSATGAQAALTSKSSRRKPERTLLAMANPDFGSTKRFGDLDDLPGQRPFDAASRPFDAASRPVVLPSRAFDSVARGGRIAPLPGTQREADALNREFPDASIYTGREAQERVAKRETGKYRYLHFATHGFLNDAAPLLSSIVLANPEPGSKEDGFLTAREIFDMDLSAEMAVLSACNTARGVQRSGDGVIGLTWALFVAGCPTQVVSQWSVDDASTATLMERYYAGIAKGQPKGAALRQAALSLMKDPKHRHPYYWAPFILMGDWR